jgi:tetratricopeptide (TPR) repeat protein
MTNPDDSNDDNNDPLVTEDSPVIQLAMQQAQQILGDEVAGLSAQEVSLYLFSRAVITKMVPSSGIDQEIDDWEHLVPMWRKLPGYTDVATREQRAYQTVLAAAGMAYFRRYEQNHQKKDVAKSVELWQAALKNCPLDTPMLAGRLNLFGYALTELYKRSANVSHLKQAVQALEQAAQLTEVGSEEWRNSMNNLGNVLRIRYEVSGKTAYQDRAIQVYGQLVEHTPLDSSDLPVHLHNLCAGLLERFNYTHDMADLDRAIRGWEEMIERTTPDSPHRLMFLLNLCNGITMRSVMKGDVEDMRRSIKYIALLLDELPPQDSDERTNFLDHLIRTIGLLLKETHDDLDDLNAMIQVIEHVIDHAPPDARDLPIILNFLVILYMKRAAVTGNDADHKRTLQLLEQALAVAKPGSFYQMQCLFNLGGRLSGEYSQSQDIAVLNRAIDLLEQALALKPKEHVRPSYQKVLADALQKRFERTEDMADLERINKLLRT